MSFRFFFLSKTDVNCISYARIARRVISEQSTFGAQSNPAGAPAGGISDGQRQVSHPLSKTDKKHMNHVKTSPYPLKVPPPTLQKPLSLPLLHPFQIKKAKISRNPLTFPQNTCIIKIQGCVDFGQRPPLVRITALHFGRVERAVISFYYV